VLRPTPTFSYVVFGLLGFVVSGALALFVIYSNILEEDIGDFRVGFVASPSSEPVRTANASFGSSNGQPDLLRPRGATAALV